MLTGAALLFVPGVGPVIAAGTLATAMLGGLEGAVAGAAVTGVLGWLSALGVSKDHILKYEESVKAGKFEEEYIVTLRFPYSPRGVGTPP